MNAISKSIVHLVLEFQVGVASLRTMVRPRQFNISKGWIVAGNHSKFARGHHHLSGKNGRCSGTTSYSNK